MGCTTNKNIINSISLSNANLANINYKINKKYAHVPNNCLVVAAVKLKTLEELKEYKGKGTLRSIPAPKEYFPIKRHYFLEVDGYILDNGFLNTIIIK